MIGARLKQARLLAGMTLKGLAHAMCESDYKITSSAISKYERGKSQPPAQFLLLASEILEVPSAYFLHIATKTVQWHAFRCRARLSKAERNRIKAFASDVAELHIELRELLYPGFAPALPSMPVETLEDAERAAEQLRIAWKVGDRPLDNLVQIAEDRGIIVIDWYDSTGLFDGLSGVCGAHPIAVVKSNVPADRKRLSLAHEIGHLVMKVGEMPEKEQEKLAYRFAAALLAPAAHAVHELSEWRKNLSWGELQSLKRKYGMSMAAWIRRARDLEMISKNTYASMNRYLRAKGWYLDEPGEYLGDEEPLQLKQMAQRAIAEGLVAPDRFEHLGICDAGLDDDMMPRGDYPSATELLAMDEDERQQWMVKMFELAENLDFEVFEAYGEEEF